MENIKPYQNLEQEKQSEEEQKLQQIKQLEEKLDEARKHLEGLEAFSRADGYIDDIEKIQNKEIEIKKIERALNQLKYSEIEDGNSNEDLLSGVVVGELVDRIKEDHQLSEYYQKAEKILKEANPSKTPNKREVVMEIVTMLTFDDATGDEKKLLKRLELMATENLKEDVDFIEIFEIDVKKFKIKKIREDISNHSELSKIYVHRKIAILKQERLDTVKRSRVLNDMFVYLKRLGDAQILKDFVLIVRENKKI